MIINLLLNLLVLILGGIFSWLPEITTLPTIADYDIDTALVTGMGYFNSFATAVWPLKVLMQGFLFLLGYYLVKVALKFFLGSRTPGA